MVRAMKPADRAAVDKVLGLFFVRQDDGYHNKRADEEIGIAQPAIRAARENGKGGGRPRKNPVGFKEEPNGLSGETQNETHEEPNGGQPPTTILQPPPANLDPPPSNRQEKTKARKRAAIRPQGVSEKVWSDFLEIRRAKRAPLTDTALRGIEREAGKAGITLQTALEMACARGWQGFEAAWLGGSKPDVKEEARRRIFGNEKDITHEAERL